MNYQLIALDLDGTLLDSRKNLPEETARAIRKVCAAGKTVVFDTGRGIPELAEPFALLPEVRYAVFTSGAGLYDTREKKAFGLRTIPAEFVRPGFTHPEQQACINPVIQEHVHLDDIFSDAFSLIQDHLTQQFHNGPPPKKRTFPQEMWELYAIFPNISMEKMFQKC